MALVVTAVTLALVVILVTADTLALVATLVTVVKMANPVLVVNQVTAEAAFLASLVTLDTQDIVALVQ